MFKIAFLAAAGFLLASGSVRAQNILVDGDFSVNPGVTSGTATSQGGGTYQYVLTTGTTTTDGGLVTGLGGTGGWSLQNGGTLPGSTLQDNSAIYVVNTAANPDSWIPTAAASNTNNYVVQLDTISTLATWKTGNGIYQTVNVTAGQAYALTFSINTESGPGKAGTSGADVMVTNATITSSIGSTATISTSSTTNLNALSYGNVTGYQYEDDTTASSSGATSLTWATYTMYFTATGSSTEIAFADDPVSTNSNISLEQVSLTAVPEPREWSALILIVGMALITFRKLRRPTVTLAT